MLSCFDVLSLPIVPVTLGMYKDPPELNKTLTKENMEEDGEAGCKVGSYARCQLMGIKPSPMIIVFPTVFLTSEDLGLRGDETLPEVYAKAEGLGLLLCPPEVAPVHRISYREQLPGEKVYVCHPPFVAENGIQSIFTLFRDGRNRWLHTDYFLGDGRFCLKIAPGARWVFGAPRPR